jgi:hypothetical protein
MVEKNNKPLSILERIQAGAKSKKIDVNVYELRAEIVRLAKEQDEVGLMDIYEAMLDFERDTIENESAAELAQRTKENLDLLANAADQEEMGADKEESFLMAADDVADIGEITNFYRKVVNFVPRKKK